MLQVVSESRPALVEFGVDLPEHVHWSMLVVSIELLVARQEEINVGGNLRTLHMKRAKI